jgi:hypothetical protein
MISRRIWDLSLITPEGIFDEPALAQALCLATECGVGSIVEAGHVDKSECRKTFAMSCVLGH